MSLPSAMADPWQRSRGSFRLCCQWRGRLALGYRFGTGVELGMDALGTRAGQRYLPWPVT